MIQQLAHQDSDGVSEAVSRDYHHWVELEVLGVVKAQEVTTQVAHPNQDRANCPLSVFVVENVDQSLHGCPERVGRFKLAQG